MIFRIQEFKTNEVVEQLFFDRESVQTYTNNGSYWIYHFIELDFINKQIIVNESWTKKTIIRNEFVNLTLNDIQTKYFTFCKENGKQPTKLYISENILRNIYKDMEPYLLYEQFIQGHDRICGMEVHTLYYEDDHINVSL